MDAPLGINIAFFSGFEHVHPLDPLVATTGPNYAN